MYLKLELGDKVRCIKDKVTKYDLGASGWVDTGVAFTKGEVHTVSSVDTLPHKAYVIDPEDGCYHAVTDEYFEKYNPES